MLKKAASGVLALLPCSRTGSTLRASKRLRPCWTNFFEHSLSLLSVAVLKHLWPMDMIYSADPYRILGSKRLGKLTEKGGYVRVGKLILGYHFFFL
jgi:hypothetical protein